MRTLFLLLLTALGLSAQSPATLPPLPPLASGPTIRWDAPTDPQVTGHRIYWGMASNVWQTNWVVLSPTNRFTLPFREPGTNWMAVQALARQPSAPGSTNLIDAVSELSERVPHYVPQPPQKIQMEIVVEASASPTGPFNPIGSVTTEVATSEEHQFFRARFDDTQLTKITTLRAP
jgi:hypothetical protein